MLWVKGFLPVTKIVNLVELGKTVRLLDTNGNWHKIFPIVIDGYVIPEQKDNDKFSWKNLIHAIIYNKDGSVYEQIHVIRR